MLPVTGEWMILTFGGMEGERRVPEPPPAGFAGSGPWGIGGVNPDPPFQLRGMAVGLEAGRGGKGRAGSDQFPPP